jgi:hypothetical protein
MFQCLQWKNAKLWLWLAIVADVYLVADGLLSDLERLVGPGTYVVQLTRLKHGRPVHVVIGV